MCYLTLFATVHDSVYNELNFRGIPSIPGGILSTVVGRPGLLVNRSSDHSCTSGMIHNKIHLIRPGRPWPSAESWPKTPFNIPSIPNSKPVCNTEIPKPKVQVVSVYCIL